MRASQPLSRPAAVPCRGRAARRAAQPRIQASVRSRPSASPTPRLPAQHLARQRGSTALRMTSPGRSGACSSSKARRRRRARAARPPARPRWSRSRCRCCRRPPSPSGGGEVGGDDVADVDVVARLQAVAERDRRAALDELAAEDRDDAALAVRVLARAVDVRVAQRDRRQPVQAAVEAAVALGGVLALPVGRHRRRRVVLARSGSCRRRRRSRRRWRSSRRARRRRGGRPRAR